MIALFQLQDHRCAEMPWSSRDENGDEGGDMTIKTKIVHHSLHPKLLPKLLKNCDHRWLIVVQRQNFPRGQEQLKPFLSRNSAIRMFCQWNFRQQFSANGSIDRLGKAKLFPSSSRKGHQRAPLTCWVNRSKHSASSCVLNTSFFLSKPQDTIFPGKVVLCQTPILPAAAVTGITAFTHRRLFFAVGS